MIDREKELLDKIDTLVETIERLRRVIKSSSPYLCGNKQCGNRIEPITCPCCGHVIFK